MRIELKKFRSSTPETNSSPEYTAALYINGISVATVAKDNSGDIEIKPVCLESGRLLSGANLYCKSLPPRWVIDGPHAALLQMDLTAYVRELADGILFQRQLAHDMHTNILIGDPDKQQYRKYPLQDYSIWKLLKYPERTETLKQILLEDVMPQLQPGEIILNPNIPYNLLALVNKRQEIIAQHIPAAATRNGPPLRKDQLSRKKRGP
ncbi:hypothetical protein [Chitinophaga tropicalis]|uniref:Uncharacterized protein n=1 Tax=Chitinophaga tropicalis TaxID=2683588 RepID=A0A7K1U059_9BACT|nr:hypothetical protein [Chitinophaga tropicalis]MVT07733.1 hypothetical protein [Chitinophaga tropicalis]